MNTPKQLPDMNRADGSRKAVSTALYTPTNFHRVFYNQAIPVFNAFANKPTRILLFFLSAADGNNLVSCTYKDIMEACGIKDKNTVSATLKQLMEMEVLVKVSASRYMVNPAVALKGDNQKFGFLASQFNALVFQNQRISKTRKD